MNGTYGRVLDIDLSTRSARVLPASDDILAATLGGKGLATWLLLRHNPPGVDPLGPDNRLIFATGPLCQSRAWGASRYGVYAKSPQTGLYAESYSGGKVPEAVDAAGYDAVMIHGRAESPTVLRVRPDGCEFLSAGDIWGREAFETEDLVNERFAADRPRGYKSGCAVIGPAGERLIRCAIVANDRWRCAGRTGMGAVMGSKLLKAVLFQGDRRRPVADPAGLATQAKAFAAEGLNNKGVQAYRAFGTTMMVAIMNTAGAFPSRYWRDGTREGWERLSGETYHKEHQVTPHACQKCFMSCGRMAVIKGGRRDGLVLEGPEYETIYAFGGLCLVDEMADVAYLNDLCDRLGLDTITAGNLCGLAIEACRRGRLDLGLDYGDVDGMARLIAMIVDRQGPGELLAEGLLAAARAWGLEDLAVHVKGLEPPGYDPRVLKGMGLTYAITARGACHLRTTFYKPELAGMIPAEAIQGKAGMLVDFEDRLALFDCLVLCRFYRDLYPWPELSKVVNLVTGLDLSEDEYRAIGAHAVELTRLFNLREGLTPDMDSLPRRLLTEALPSGKALREDELRYMVADYYRLRGWDEAGRPRA